MTRTKRGAVARKRRKKVLKVTTGFRGSSSILYRCANQRKMKALTFQYRDRRQRKRHQRQLWISRINASIRLLIATKQYQPNFKYKQMICFLRRRNISLNRKTLSQFTLHEPTLFMDFGQNLFSSSLRFSKETTLITSETK